MHTEIAYGPTGAKLALMNGQTLKKAFVALPAGATAVYNSSGLEYYRHADWLGSSRLVSTPSRTVSGDTSYSPFGVPYAGSGTVVASFTGKNQDTASSLYDFPAREYGQVVARWPSPDPLDTGAFNLSNPQTLNLYAYVGNEPMGFVDPLGLGPCTVQSGCTVYVNSEPDCYMPELAGTGFFQQAPCNLVFMTGKDFTWGGLPGAMGVGWFNSGGGGGASGGTAPSPAAPQTQKQKDCAQGLQEAGQNQSAVNRALQNWGVVEDAAQASGIGTAMIAAIGVRESGFQDINQIGGGPGVGIFQITPVPGFGASQANDPSQAALYAGGLLSSNMSYLAAQFPNFTPTQLLQATAASYNFGVGNISGDPATIDVGTANGNYGSDILLLMDCF